MSDSNLVQDIAASLGTTPLNPRLPAHDKVVTSMEVIAIIVETDEYAQIRAKRRGGILDKEGFLTAFDEIYDRMESEGAFSHLEEAFQA